MHVLWTANIANDPSKKKQFQEALSLSTSVLDREKEIIEDKLGALDQIDYSSSTYKDPSWAYYQAHLNGKRAAYTEILQLLQ